MTGFWDLPGDRWPVFSVSKRYFCWKKRDARWVWCNDCYYWPLACLWLRCCPRQLRFHPELNSSVCTCQRWSRTGPAVYSATINRRSNFVIDISFCKTNLKSDENWESCGNEADGSVGCGFGDDAVGRGVPVRRWRRGRRRVRLWMQTKEASERIHSSRKDRSNRRPHQTLQQLRSSQDHRRRESLLLQCFERFYLRFLILKSGPSANEVQYSMHGWCWILERIGRCRSVEAGNRGGSFGQVGR